MEKIICAFETDFTIFFNDKRFKKWKRTKTL
jgi:hypothetical protein